MREYSSVLAEVRIEKKPKSSGTQNDGPATIAVDETGVTLQEIKQLTAKRNRVLGDVCLYVCGRVRARSTPAVCAPSVAVSTCRDSQIAEGRRLLHQSYSRLT